MKSIPKMKIMLKMMMTKNNDDPKVKMTTKIKTVTRLGLQCRTPHRSYPLS